MCHSHRANRSDQLSISSRWSLALLSAAETDLRRSHSVSHRSDIMFDFYCCWLHGCEFNRHPMSFLRISRSQAEMRCRRMNQACCDDFTREFIRIMNMGQMNVDRNRRGSFKGLTPLNEFRILITAEDIAATTQPSEEVMLRTELIIVR